MKIKWAISLLLLLLKIQRYNQINILLWVMTHIECAPWLVQWNACAFTHSNWDSSSSLMHQINVAGYERCNMYLKVFLDLLVSAYYWS